MNKILGNIYIVGRNSLPFIIERLGLREVNLTSGAFNLLGKAFFKNGKG